ncbi:hypothetical protein [Bacillus sp. JCM 19041]
MEETHWLLVVVPIVMAILMGSAALVIRMKLLKSQPRPDGS